MTTRGLTLARFRVYMKKKKKNKQNYCKITCRENNVEKKKSLGMRIKTKKLN